MRAAGAGHTPGSAVTPWFAVALVGSPLAAASRCGPRTTCATGESQSCTCKGCPGLIAEFVGQRSLKVSGDTYTHVLMDEREVDYPVAAAYCGRPAGR
jgi:hypothetical protein